MASFIHKVNALDLALETDGLHMPWRSSCCRTGSKSGLPVLSRAVAAGRPRRRRSLAAAGAHGVPSCAPWWRRVGRRRRCRASELRNQSHRPAAASRKAFSEAPRLSAKAPNTSATAGKARTNPRMMDTGRARPVWPTKAPSRIGTMQKAATVSMQAANASSEAVATAVPACCAAQSSKARVLAVVGAACQLSGNSISRLRTFGRSLNTM